MEAQEVLPLKFPTYVALGTRVSLENKVELFAQSFSLIDTITDNVNFYIHDGPYISMQKPSFSTSLNTD